MSDETLQQQPPTFSDELYKYAHDSGFIPKEATVDIFKKNLSNKDFVKELYDYSVQTDFIPKEATIDIFINNIGGTTPDLKKKGSTELPSGGGSSDLPKTDTYSSAFAGRQQAAIGAMGTEQPKPYTTSQVAVERKKKVELNPTLKGAAQTYKDYKAANENLRNAQMDLTAGLQGEKDVIQTDVLGKPVAIQGSITEQKIKGLKENVDLAKANKQAAKESLIKVSPAFKDKNIDIVAELQKDNTDVEETVIPQAVEKIKFVEDISDLEDNLKANGQTLDDWSKYVDTEAPKEFLDDKQRALFDVIKTGDEGKIKTATDLYYKDIDDQISQIDKDITALSVGKFDTAVDVPQRVADLKKQKQDLIDSKAGALQPEQALKIVAGIDSSFDVVDKMLKDIPPMQRARLLFDKLYADKIKEQAKFGKDMSDTKAMGTGFGAVTERNKLRDIDQALKVLASVVFLNQKPDMEQSGWTRFGRGVWNSMVGDVTGVTLPKKEDIGNKVTSLMAQATVDENITPQLRESIKKTTPDITDQAIDMGAYITSILPSYGAMGAVAKGARLPALFRIGFNNVGKYAPLVGRIAPQLTRMTTEGVTSKLTGLAMDDQDELTFWGRFGGQGFTELLDKSPFGKLVSKAIGKMGVKETPAFLKVLGRVHKQGVGETGSESIEEAYTIYQNSDTFEDFKKNIKRFVDNPSEGLLFLGGTYLMGAGLGGVSPNISKKFYTAADKAYNDLPPNEKQAFDSFVKDVNQGQEDAVMEVVLKTVDKIPNKVVDGLVTDLNTAVEELGKTEVGENGYEVKIGDTVYQGNTAQDLQNDIDDAQSLLAIYKGEQDNRTQNGITIEETETPPIAEADQGDVKLAKPEAGVGVEGESSIKAANTPETAQPDVAGIERRRKQLRGKALEAIGVDERQVDGSKYEAHSKAKDYSFDRAITLAENQITANPISKLGALPMDAANAIKAELHIAGVKATDKTPLSEINDKLKEIKAKYDAELAALEATEILPQEGVTEPTKAPVIKAQVVGTTAGFNTIIDGGLGKQQDPRFTGEVLQDKSIFKVNPNNNESSFLDISLPSSDSFGRQGGIQIRFELPNGVDANTVFEAVKKEAAKLGQLDAKDPDFKSKVQGLVDKGIAEIQGLATGGAKQVVGIEGGKKSIPNKQQLIDERLDKIVSIKKAAEGTREEQRKRYDELVAEYGDMKAIEMLNKEISDRANAEIAKLEPIPTSWYQDVDKKATEDFNKITKELGFKDSDMTWNGTPLGDDMGSILVNDSKDAAIYIKPHEEEIYDETEDITETISNGIEIEFLNTKGEERGKGKAKQLLEKVIKWADSNNTDLFLTIAPQDKSTTKEGLKKLYEGYGFVFDGIKGVRKPVTKPTKNQPQEGEVKETVSDTQVSETLKDVNSTATALSKLDKGTIDAALPMQPLEIDGYKRKYRTDDPISIAEAYHKAKADGSNPDLVQAVEELLAPKGEAKAEPSVKAETNLEENVTADINNIADKSGIAPKNLRDLYNVNRSLFGLNKVKSLAAAVAMDRMVGVMAKRAGITKSEMYGRLEFKKDTEANVLKADNALFQGTVNGENVTLRNTDVDVVNGFYSPLRKIIAEAKQDKMPAKQWIEKFARGEEAKWTGLTDWLAAQQGSVSKADILDYLKNNRISIVEVVKGSKDAGGKSKQEKLQEIKDEFDNNEYGYVLTTDMSGDVVVEDSEGEYVEDILEDARLQELAEKYYELNETSNDDTDGDTKFSQYQLEGDKSNYKEVLVTLPNKKVDIVPIENKFNRNDVEIKVNRENSITGQRDVSIFYEGNEVSQRSGTYATDEEIIDDLEKRSKESTEKRAINTAKAKEEKTQFKSSHFDEPNILVHLRMNTRTDAEGNKVLFLEEIQSDWGQEGKRKGFSEKAVTLTPENTTVELSPSGQSYRLMKDGLQYADMSKETGDDFSKKDLHLELIDLANRYAKNEGQRKTPTAPFVTDTNAWVKLGLKVAMKEAVAQGADKIAWTTGEQQNDRYDLSKQVDKIDVEAVADVDNLFFVDISLSNGTTENLEVENGIIREGNYKGQRLDSVIGKDYADKIMSTPKGESVTLQGADLKVGGKGMKGFYGSPTEGSLGIVGNVAKGLFKQDVGLVKIPQGKGIVGKPTVEQLTKAKALAKQANDTDAVNFLQEQIDRLNKGQEESFGLYNPNVSASEYFDKVREPSIFTQNSITITPELRTQVQNGLALFQKQQGQTAKGAMVAADGKFIIYALTDPNVSTPLHELAHVFEHYLTDSERAAVNNWAKTGAWTTETSEKFARGFEKYLSEGIAPTEGLKKVFEKFKTWLTDIYNGIKGSNIDIELNDDMRSIYAQMLGEDAVPTKKAKAAPKKTKKAAIQSDVIDKLVGKAADRREAYKEITDENIKEVAKIITDTNGKFDKVMDAIDNNDQLLADLEKKLGMKKICKVF